MKKPTFPDKPIMPKDDVVFDDTQFTPRKISLLEILEAIKEEACADPNGDLIDDKCSNPDYEISVNLSIAEVRAIKEHITVIRQSRAAYVPMKIKRIHG